MRRLILGLVLGLFGVGLALSIGLFTLKAFGRDDILNRLFSDCNRAEGDWFETLMLLTGDYPPSCDTFYWDIYPTGEFYNLLTTNNYGMHDMQVRLEKPADTFRILVVGDSFPQAWQVRLEQGFIWLMEQTLNEDGMRKIEVINLSVHAYGTDRELLLYSVLGWRFQPDLVLLTFYTGNDLKDNSYALTALEQGKTPTYAMFTLNEQNQLQLHNAPELDPARFSDSPAWTWLVGMTQNQEPLPQDLPTVPPIRQNTPYELEYPVDLGLYLPEDEYWAQSWALTETLLLQFRDLVQQQGSAFAVVIIPDRRVVHSSDWDSTLTLFPFMHGSDPFAPTDRVEAFLTNAAIPFLNLTYTLRGWASGHPGERLYYIGDGHFNANGHKVTAQRIVFWLESEALLR